MIQVKTRSIITLAALAILIIALIVFTNKPLDSVPSKDLGRISFKIINVDIKFNRTVLVYLTNTGPSTQGEVFSSGYWEVYLDGDKCSIKRVSAPEGKIVWENQRVIVLSCSCGNISPSSHYTVWVRGASGFSDSYYYVGG